MVEELEISKSTVFSEINIVKVIDKYPNVTNLSKKSPF